MKKVLITLLLLFLCPLCSLKAVASNWNIQDGIKLIDEKKYSDAVRFFEGYVGSYPNDADGHYYLGLSYKSLQNLRKSSYHLRKSYELAGVTQDIVIAPNTSDLPDDDYMDIAQMYYEDGDYKQALTYVDMTEKINPDNHFANYLKAQIYYKQKNMAASKQYLNKALYGNPEYLKTDLAKALEVITVPPYDADYYNSKGLEYYYGANLSQAKVYFEKAVNMDKKRPDFYNNLGLACARLGEADTAKSNFKKAIFLNRHFAAPYMNLAKLEPKAAESYLKQAVKANPNNQFVYYELGNFYFDKNDYQSAIREYQNAITIDTKYFEPYFALAVCYSELGDYKSAMANVRKASELNNKSPELPYYLAKLCLLAHRPDEAMEYLKEALKKGENPVYYLELGKIYFSKEDYTSAQNCFQKALMLDIKLENEAELYNYLGLCDYKNHDVESSVYNLQKAVSLEPKNIMYNYNLSRVYKSRKNNAAAEKFQTAALTITPKSPQDYLDLATVYFDLNNPSVASKKLDEGISRFPKSRLLYEAKLRFFNSIGDEKSANIVREYIKANFTSAF